MPEESIVLGEIVLRYEMNNDVMLVNVELPDSDDVPVVVQLGMLDLARDTILRMHDDDEQDT